MITQTLCTVFKTNLLKGLENFNTGSPYVYKIALYTDVAELDASTTQYSILGAVVPDDVGTVGVNTLPPAIYPVQVLLH